MESAIRPKEYPGILGKHVGRWVDRGLLKRIGKTKGPLKGKIVVISGTHQETEPHSAYSATKAFMKKGNEEFRKFLEDNGFQVVLFSHHNWVPFSAMSEKEKQRVFSRLKEELRFPSASRKLMGLEERDAEELLSALQETGFEKLDEDMQKNVLEEVLAMPMGELSGEEQKRIRRELKLEIARREKPGMMLTVHNTHWGGLATEWTLYGLKYDSGEEFEQITLNKAPLRIDPDTEQRARLHDPQLLVYQEGKDPQTDVPGALAKHSKIPAQLLFVRQKWWSDPELRDSFCLELPVLSEKVGGGDSRKIIDYGKRVIQDMIESLVRHQLELEQNPKKQALLKGEAEPEPFYTGKAYIKPPSTSRFR